MTFEVHACFGGGGSSRSHYFQISDPRGNVPRFNVGHNRDGDRWCRDFAMAAKDYLSYFYKIPRRNIRFAL